MLRLTRPPVAKLDALLAQATSAAPAYPEVGATRTGHMPGGYRHDRDEIRLGEGPDVFGRAVDALRRWQAQVGAGVEVFPAGAWVGENETVILVIRAGGLWATAPCRVVYVIEKADRFAFAYGTLPGHPERGEVRFAIDRDESGEVVFSVSSFSRPAARLARLARPLSRRIQRRVTQGYLDALVKATA